MADSLVTWLHRTLPDEVAELTRSYLKQLEDGDYEGLLQCPNARALLGKNESIENLEAKLKNVDSWSDMVQQRLDFCLADSTNHENEVILFCVGYAALLAFVQSTVTGPPLTFKSANLLLPLDVSGNTSGEKTIQAKLLESLSADGIPAYKLTSNIELLCLAKGIMSHVLVLENVKAARWAKLRISFIQQRLLSEPSYSLQETIYDDLDLLQDAIEGSDKNLWVEFLLERSTIHIYHGLDKFARADLEQATAARQFDFALTGLLGKRTKFQEKEVSQLVVLAKSHINNGVETQSQHDASVRPTDRNKPTNLDLDDDTLLNSISFAKQPPNSIASGVQDSSQLSDGLKSLDPSDQPQLQPLDSVILLLSASSITNTSPQNGLTREETLPYAVRVLEGGSSNWQVYTQALLVRSRIEGYRSRTMERGLLQLQTLVDQVIADTGDYGVTGDQTQAKPSTFLPQGQKSESAAATDRLRYIFQLATPTRWELEAELAARWVQLGGLRSALDIYERLQMWPEAALCWAATEREDKARRIIRRQLFHTTSGVSEDNISDDEEWSGAARRPPPADAPRLYCILGDMDQSVKMYEMAWKVSNERYARAQRSIGRLFLAQQDFVRAAEAYSKSLNVNQLNHASWFALGCALLELAQFQRAVEAFSRCVQLDDTDAESWSNLGAALLRTEPDDGDSATSGAAPAIADDEDDSVAPVRKVKGHQQIRLDALRALKRAASLKHDSHRIWENVLIVAASLSPPDCSAMLSAQKRIIALRGPIDGEKCIDVPILASLVTQTIAENATYDPAQPGLPRVVVKFIDSDVVPLITASGTLWQLISKLALWRNKPSSALEAEEKAWRAVTSQPGWETESEKRWDEVVEATVRLCDSYESFGPMERTEGMAAGSGEVVMKDWKFKARSAVRGILGRGKDSWDGTEGWERLRATMESLKG